MANIKIIFCFLCDEIGTHLPYFMTSLKLFWLFTFISFCTKKTFFLKIYDSNYSYFEQIWGYFWILMSQIKISQKIPYKRSWVYTQHAFISHILNEVHGIPCAALRFLLFTAVRRIIYSHLLALLRYVCVSYVRGDIRINANKASCEAKCHCHPTSSSLGDFDFFFFIVVVVVVVVFAMNLYTSIRVQYEISWCQMMHSRMLYVLSFNFLFMKFVWILVVFSNAYRYLIKFIANSE